MFWTRAAIFRTHCCDVAGTVLCAFLTLNGAVSHTIVSSGLPVPLATLRLAVSSLSFLSCTCCKLNFFSPQVFGTLCHACFSEWSVTLHPGMTDECTNA